MPLVVDAPDILEVGLIVITAADDTAVPVEPALVLAGTPELKAVLDAEAAVEDELDPATVAGPTSDCSPERGSVASPHPSATSLSVPP